MNHHTTHAGLALEQGRISAPDLVPLVTGILLPQAVEVTSYGYRHISRGGSVLLQERANAAAHDGSLRHFHVWIELRGRDGRMIE